MRAEAVLSMRLISNMGRSGATSASNLKPGESQHHTPHPLFDLIPRASEREARKFTRFLSPLVRRVGPLSLFFSPASPAGCIFMRARHRADSCKHVASKLPYVFARDGVERVRECVSARVHAALHALWSLLSFLPLMLFPVVSKLPHWCTILSHALFANKDLGFSACNLEG